MSSLLQGRGLKHGSSRKSGRLSVVVPPAGAWIETGSALGKLGSPIKGRVTSLGVQLAGG
ncbi:hypothetical protein DESC_320074 [Desulfosarcina cetonica]|nr:hypothetical protein DESC_320074 [Desulfosarcina cetonica]